MTIRAIVTAQVPSAAPKNSEATPTVSTATLTRPATVERGRAHPQGAVPDSQGVNFSIISEHATSVELLLFENHDDVEPSRAIQLDPDVNKTFHFWHCYVRGVKPGTFYAYRIDGPRDTAGGHRFDPEKVLIDPYSRGVSKTLWQRGDACQPGSNLSTSLRSAIIDTSDYDWEGDEPLRRPLHETVIYEMHVKGFTQSPSSGVARPGTYTGVIEKIPYLKQLGVTAVELLPVFAFDDTEVLRTTDGNPLRNYWGYSTMSYFAPHSGYSVSPQQAQQVREFRDMVKALHRAGVEVILDVVYNHTDEGNHQGPVYEFKGIDNCLYYYLSTENKQFYYDYTGCGNTFNCNHPVGEKLIIDSLEYWVKEMHVDGFRFDEGTVLTRGEDGAPMKHPPVIWQIELSDTLADTKVFAEAWDAAGLYEVGYFPGHRWGEWNGHFRDDIRRFVKGDGGVIGDVAKRLAGSADLYQADDRLPINSVNFVTCHDGFTLNDLVSYNEKHNDANGEQNRDGINDNLSWNCGAEGETDDAEVERLRERQIRNFATIMMLSRGVPMLVAGDEVRRTQRGNNNAYCQDSDISWFDWTCPDRHDELLRFWRIIIDHRRRYTAAHRARFYTGDVNKRGLADLSWHGTQLFQPEWDNPEARALAMTLGGFDGEGDLHVMMNMHWEPLSFDVPEIHGARWHRVADTSRPSPEDIAEPGEEVPFDGNEYLVGDRTIVVLVSK